MYRIIATASALLAVANAQKVCTLNAEKKPALTWSKCTSSGCSNIQSSVTVDANWRWTHSINGDTNCYSGNKWDASFCPTGKACAENCCLDGADYSGTYGVTSSGNALNLKFVTNGPYSTNVGSRLYLMEDENNYQMFTLLGNEFTFDVDVSNIGCGLNGALYFVSMDKDGGKSRYSGNKAGASYGTGYCDAQCPRDVKFIDGVANSEGWKPSASDSNAGVGQKGTCCPEMDIWEANSISTAFTPHTCTGLKQSSCTGDSCGGTYSAERYAGTCDPDGCDFNPYRQGNKTFYGPGSNFNVDTTKKVTVVTQFIKGSNGKLSEIKRLYLQNGKLIANPESKIVGNSGNSITQEFCTNQKKVFGDRNVFEERGNFPAMSDALAAPMVLVMSLWHDHHSNMLWLDATYPKGATNPGAARGSCGPDSGDPKTLEKTVPNASVQFSNIKFGPVGSTYGGTTTPEPQPSQPGTPEPSQPPVGGTVSQWGQCGGQNYNGPKTCVSPFKCNKINDFYSQCY